MTPTTVYKLVVLEYMSVFLYFSCGFSMNDFQADYSDKSNVSPKSSAKKKKGKPKDDDDECSSEEERWLHAIEAGKLEEVRFFFAVSFVNPYRLLCANWRFDYRSTMNWRKLSRKIPNWWPLVNELCWNVNRIRMGSANSYYPFRQVYQLEKLILWRVYR